MISRIAVHRLLGACCLALVLPVPGEGRQLPRRATREIVRVGGADAPEWASFSSAPNLITGPDGSVYALVPPEARVVVLDSAGRFVRTIGAKGEGPGEFNFAFGHGFLGDTLWVRNWPLPRMSQFRIDGTHLHTARSDLALPIRFAMPVGITHLLRSGRILFIPDDAPRDAPGRATVPVLTGSRSLERLDTVLHVVRPHGGLVLAGIGVVTFSIFAIPPLISVSPDGSGFTVVDWVDRAAEVRVRRFDHLGVVQWSRSLSLASPAIPRRVRDSILAVAIPRARPHVERERRAGRDRGGGALSVEVLVEQGLALPAHYPPVSRVVAGGDGTTWLQRGAPGEQQLWMVLDSTGNPEFEVMMPRGIRLQHASRRVIWGTTVDAADAHVVVRLGVAGG